METTDYETLVLSAALRQGQVRELLDAAPPEDIFKNAHNLNIFQKMVEYGPTTDLHIVHTVYPNWQPLQADQPMSVYLDHLVTMRANDELFDLLNNALKEGDVNPAVMGDIAQKVEQKYRDASASEIWNSFVWLGENAAQFLREQDDQGIPMGIPSIDIATGGWLPGQLITLTALAKQGKSTALIKMMHVAKLAGRRVLFCSFEMTAKELMRMLVSLSTGADLNDIKQVTLTKTERDRVEQEMRRLRTLEDALIIDKRMEFDTISKLRRLMERHQSDLIIVDGIYMMNDEEGGEPGSPRALTNITRALKLLAMDRQVPIVISTQSLMSKTVRGKLNMYSGGYSSSYAQDSDVVLGLRRLGGEYTELDILAIRSGSPTNAYVKVDWKAGDIYEVDRGDTGLVALLNSGDGASSGVQSSAGGL